MYHAHKQQAEFLLVYIREAHPDSVLFTLVGGKEKLLKVAQTNDLAARGHAAEHCMATLKLSLPTVLDREDNKVNSAYAGWPDRLYVVDVDGKIAYKGGPGPKGFKIEEVEGWLVRNSIHQPAPAIGKSSR